MQLLINLILKHSDEQVVNLILMEQAEILEQEETVIN